MVFRGPASGIDGNPARWVMPGSLCLICGRASTRRVLEREGFSLARCASCGFIQQDPLPDLAEMLAGYEQQEYYLGEVLASESEYLERDRRVVRYLEQCVPTSG